MNNIKTVLKPWGKEEWIELNENYCYKRIYINKNYKTSYQYHEKKRETNYIISGSAEVWLENENGIVEKTIKNCGDYFNVLPLRKHRIIAITDLILQEVSTPEVDDVIRIEDDTNRKNGKIEEEHVKPSILILAAGLGSRLKEHTDFKNKALVPIDNKAIISHIIEKFPSDYEIIISIGYQKESLKEYCNLAHADRKIIFVEVDKWDNPKTDPGYSAFLCKNYLQKPFYLISVDTLVKSKIPDLNKNWIGISEADEMKKYATVEIENENVIQIKNKTKISFNYAFIGFAGIKEYKIFWEELENNTPNFELVSAWKNPRKYSLLKAQKFDWLDVGNLEDFNRAKIYFKENLLSTKKYINEITYKVNNSVLKFNPDKNINKNKYLRAKKLGKLIPNNCKITNFFLKYDWIDGYDLYHYDSLNLYINFLNFFEKIINDSDKWNTNINLIDTFYKNKTINRKNQFINKYGDKYLNEQFNINNCLYPKLNTLLDKINYSIFLENKIYEKFHGDLHFDNIIYDENEKIFKYIDWRDSFAENIFGGDIYYDLAKLYAGCLFPFSLFKQKENIDYLENNNIIIFNYEISNSIIQFTKQYELWLNSNGFCFNKVKLLTGLIYLNIAPLHDDIFNKIFLFKSIELLYGSI